MLKACQRRQTAETGALLEFVSMHAQTAIVLVQELYLGDPPQATFEPTTTQSPAQLTPPPTILPVTYPTKLCHGTVANGTTRTPVCEGAVSKAPVPQKTVPVSSCCPPPHQNPTPLTASHQPTDRGCTADNRLAKHKPALLTEHQPSSVCMVIVASRCSELGVTPPRQPWLDASQYQVLQHQHPIAGPARPSLPANIVWLVHCVHLHSHPACFKPML